MSQSEIYNLLKESNEPISLREIASLIDIALTNISKQIQTMIKFDEILFKEIRAKELKEYCKKKHLSIPKRKIRLYYLNKK